VGTGGCFAGGKHLGCEANHSSPFNFEVKMRGAIRPLPYTCSWLGA